MREEKIYFFLSYFQSHICLRNFGATYKSMDLAVSKGGKGGRGAGGRKKVSKSSKAGLQVSPKGVSLWRLFSEICFALVHPLLH